MVPLELVVSGIAFIATAVIGAGIRKVWVWGWNLTDLAAQYEKVIAYRDQRIKDIGADRDRWKRLAMRQAGVLEDSVNVVEKAADGG